MSYVHPVTLTEMREFIRERFKSREYWIVVCGASEAGAEFLGDIEDRHYAGKANVDFDLFVQPTGIAIALCHKRRMSAGQLLRILRRHADPVVVEAARRELAEGRDILFLEEEGTVGLQSAFVNFICADTASAMRN
jgi:hypothetical protein